MKLPEPVVDNFRDQLTEPLAELLETWQLRDDKSGPGESSPPLLVETFPQLYDAMQRTEASLSRGAAATGGNPASAEGVTELGEYALELFDQSLHWANHLDLPEVFDTLQAFTIAMACWIGRHGGELINLEPVADALARAANRTQEAGELLTLYRAMGEVIEATASLIRQDLDKSNPGRPWRILHLNRAIVATRSHQPDIMDEAFAVLIEHLPEDAPGFFTQGMEQMDLLNYPPHVREVMDRYYRKWSVNRSLH
ncbi:MAG TPA: hypothetical protein ENJ80_14455 [Gammaproteobacteria bacterium]|nr:hypothetical protein [Gammaproteobacteria bacterium]